MKIDIRTERAADFEAIERIIIAAFKHAEHSDGNEQDIARQIRHSDHYIPQLALVAEVDGALAGHVLFPRIFIRKANGRATESLALGPVSVSPGYQGKGIGSALISTGHRIAKQMGYSSVILVGNPDYYSRFGYTKASKWGIQAPFDLPEEAFMAIELEAGALQNAAGIVEYPPAFGI